MIMIAPEATPSQLKFGTDTRAPAREINPVLNSLGR